MIEYIALAIAIIAIIQNVILMKSMVRLKAHIMGMDYDPSLAQAQIITQKAKDVTGEMLNKVLPFGKDKEKKQ